MMIPAHEPWLAQVPADWRSARIRTVAQLSPGYSGGAPVADEACTVVPMELVSESGKLDATEALAFSDVSDGLTLFERGDILFAKITPCMENGKGAFVESLPTRYAFGSTEFHVLRANHAAQPKFIYYYTFNPTYRAYAAANMVGAAGQKRVSSRFLKDTRLFVPSINEQVRIAAFLDDSCMVIDAVMTTKRRQIDALNELRSSILDGSLLNGVHGEKATKGSGSSVIPQIPSRWRVARLKSVANVRYGLGQPPAPLDSGVPMIRATDVDAGQISPDRLMRVDPEDLPLDRKPYLKAGEIIVVRSGAYTGDSAIVPPSLVGCVAGYDMVVTVERASAEFVAYCLLSRYVLQGQLFLLKQRAAQPHLNAEQLGGVVLALPPTHSEQEDIVKFLDQRLGQIVEASRCIERQIEALASYRKSLIHECVIGQRRITDADLDRVKAHAQKEAA